MRPDATRALLAVLLITCVAGAPLWGQRAKNLSKMSDKELKRFCDKAERQSQQNCDSYDSSADFYEVARGACERGRRGGEKNVVRCQNERIRRLGVRAPAAVRPPSLPPVQRRPSPCDGTVRFLDKKDGTVLDCNTGLVWLKNANCLGKAEWEGAKKAAAELASGSCDLSDGSSRGDWRLPRPTEFCRTFSGKKGLACPATASPHSLMNSNFAAPALSNAMGDGTWAPGNPFLGVLGDGVYWSGTQLNSTWSWTGWMEEGSVLPWQKTLSARVWPVREGR